VAGSPDQQRDVLRGGLMKSWENRRSFWACAGGRYRPLLPSVSLWPGSDHFSPHVCARPTAPYPIVVVASHHFCRVEIFGLCEFQKKTPSHQEKQTDSQLRLLRLGW